MRRLLPALAALSVAALLLAPGAAEAIPAFARKYTAPCALCHDRAPPALNDVGRRFKERGYQLEEAAERGYREARGARPNPEEPLLLLSDLPLALRAQSRAVLETDPRATGRNALELRPFESLFFLVGASVYPNVSFIASATVAPTVALHHAALGFHDLLLGEGRLNLRFGRLLVFDFQRPEHRFLTGFGNPIATTRVGLNPTVLDSTQHGVDVFGRLLGRRLFYRMAVVQGAQGPDGLSDLDPHKDLLAELGLDLLSRLRLGLLGYRGKTQITDATRGLEVRFTDPFAAVVARAELATAPLDLFAQVVYVNHEDPFGTGEHADYTGFRLEARASLSPRWLLVGRYDQLDSHHLEEARFKAATVHVSWLLLSNLRVAVESSAPLEELEASALSLRLDLAL